MRVSSFEIVKEYVFSLEMGGRPLVVRGRVAKSLDDDRYYWDISHHYRPAADAGVYYPSGIVFDEADHAKHALLRYGQKFVAEHGVVANEYY